MKKSTLNIVAVQYSMVWEDIAANIKTLEEKWFKNIEADTDIIVLPEMFSTGFTMDVSFAEKMDGATIQWMKKISSEKNVAICGSIPIRENEDFKNRFIWIDHEELHYYDKRHLFTFGKENLHYKRGEENKPITYKGWKILPQICYDLRFPVWSRNVHNYDLMLYIASWPSKRVNAWSQLLIARAIENLAYVCGVNRVGEDGNGLVYTGQSVIIDHEGNEIEKLGNKEALIQATLDKNEMETFRSKFGFLNDADNFKMNV